jgi:hypothetical protein
LGCINIVVSYFGLYQYSMAPYFLLYQHSVSPYFGLYQYSVAPYFLLCQYSIGPYLRLYQQRGPLLAVSVQYDPNLLENEIRLHFCSK